MLTGFHQPYLISYLAEVGIHVDSIIRIVTENYERFELQAASDADPELLAEDEEKEKGVVELFLKISIGN